LILPCAWAEVGDPKTPSLPPPAASAVSPADPLLPEHEGQVERRLLELANSSRAQSGASALALDAELSRAARIHAQRMLEARQLSHRFDGELSVPRRLATVTHLQLDLAAENVALDYSAEGGHQHLMLSPPHRANLLNPAYNVVGLGVVRSGNRLYIVQDFGHAIPAYSLNDVQQHLTKTVNRMRRQAGRPELQRVEFPAADDAACSMAQSDILRTATVKHLAERYTVLAFTSLNPDTLPEGAVASINSPNLRSTATGVCYALTDTYPAGTYWVVLLLD